MATSNTATFHTAQPIRRSYSSALGLVMLSLRQAIRVITQLNKLPFEPLGHVRTTYRPARKKLSPGGWWWWGGGGATPLLGLNRDVWPDRAWFLGFFFLERGIYFTPFCLVLKGVSLHGPMSNRIDLYACRGLSYTNLVTSRFFTNSSVLLTCVDFGIHA